VIVDILVVSSDLDWMMRISDLLRPLAPATFSSLEAALGETHSRPTVLVVAPKDLDALLSDPGALREGAVGAVGVTDGVTVDLLRRAMAAGVGDVVDEAHLETLLAAVEGVARRTAVRGSAGAAAASGTVGKVVVVTSAKGGQGATTIAANLAVSLSAHGTTAIVEGDPRFGDLIDAFGYRQGRTEVVPAGLVSGHWVDEVLYRHPSGPLIVLPRQDSGETLDPDAAVDAVDALQRSCAYTVIDIPFWALDRFRVHRVADLVLVVSTERERDLARVPILVRSLGLTPGLTRLVISDQTEADAPRRAAAEALTGLQPAAWIPETAKAAAALERGEPLAVHDPDDPASLAFAAMARTIAGG
jgi:MinD-like ATPase involved in chromosome partitioning or flagellar assembly